MSSEETGLEVRSLPNHRATLEGFGFQLRCEKQWLRGLLVSQLWQTLKPETGQPNAAVNLLSH